MSRPDRVTSPEAFWRMPHGALEGPRSIVCSGVGAAEGIKQNGGEGEVSKRLAADEKQIERLRKKKHIGDVDAKHDVGNHALASMLPQGFSSQGAAPPPLTSTRTQRIRQGMNASRTTRCPGLHAGCAKGVGGSVGHAGRGGSTDKEPASILTFSCM
jgi:hypothetical protein